MLVSGKCWFPFFFNHFHPSKSARQEKKQGNKLEVTLLGGGRGVLRICCNLFLVSLRKESTLHSVVCVSSEQNIKSNSHRMISLLWPLLGRYLLNAHNYFLIDLQSNVRAVCFCDWARKNRRRRKKKTKQANKPKKKEKYMKCRNIQWSYRATLRKKNKVKIMRIKS